MLFCSVVPLVTINVFQLNTVFIIQDLYTVYAFKGLDHVSL